MLKNIKIFWTEHLNPILKGTKDTYIPSKSAHIYAVYMHIRNNKLQTFSCLDILEDRVFLVLRVLAFAKYVHKSTGGMEGLEKVWPDGGSYAVGKTMRGPLTTIGIERAVIVGMKITGNNLS